MPKKITLDLSVVVPILVGIIVLLGVYIIVNKGQGNHVRFSDPVVTEEIIYQPDYYRSEPVLFTQPTYFVPGHGGLPGHGGERGTTNMYNIQMKEPFMGSEFVSGLFNPPSTSSTTTSMIPSQSSTMPNMNFASQAVPMVIPSPMESTADTASAI